MNDDWEDFDEFDLEEEMQRQEEYELSPAGIAEENRQMLDRQRHSRLAVDCTIRLFGRRGGLVRHAEEGEDVEVE